jgi:hypothetical protein
VVSKKTAKKEKLTKGKKIKTGTHVPALKVGSGARI